MVNSVLLTTCYMVWKALFRPGSLNPVPATLLALGLAGAAVASPRQESPLEPPLSLGEIAGGVLGIVRMVLHLAAPPPRPESVPLFS